MTDPFKVNPFEEGASQEGAPHFRLDPDDAPVESAGLSLYGPDTPGYRRTDLATFWHDWFDTDGMTLESTYQWRLPVAWRVLRVQAALRGVLAEPRQMLRDVTNNTPSPWFEPFHLYGAMGSDRTINTICTAQQLPLLPPDIPAGHREGTAIQTYNPDDDRALDAYVRMIEHITRRLGIARTREGRNGLAGLTNPRVIRAAMPHPIAIMEFEAALVEKTVETLIEFGESGPTGVRAELRREYDLTTPEVQSVLAMCRRYARDASGIDDYMDLLAMDAMRLDWISQKQQSQEDYRGAVQTIRDKARLVLQARQGSSTGEDDDFGSIVDAEVAREQKKIAPKPDPGGMLED